MADSDKDRVPYITDHQPADEASAETKLKEVAAGAWWRQLPRLWPMRREPKLEYPRMRPRKWLRVLGWRHLLAILVSFFALFPIVWIISSSINPINTLSGAKLIPDNATLSNYGEIISNPPLSPFLTWLWNSWKVAILAATFNVILASMAAYAFSRFRFRGRRLGLLTLLLVQVFPQFLMFIAIFLLVQRIGEAFPALGLNTHAGLVLVYLGGAVGFNTFLIKGFMDSVPISIDESARVDGAGHSIIFWRIIMPLVRPVLAVIFIITVVFTFSEYVLARTLLRSAGQLTYAVGLQTYSLSDYGAKWGFLTAGAVVGAIPIVITFLIAQRAIISGLTQGAVKG